MLSIFSGECLLHLNHERWHTIVVACWAPPPKTQRAATNMNLIVPRTPEYSHPTSSSRNINKRQLSQVECGWQSPACLSDPEPHDDEARQRIMTQARTPFFRSEKPMSLLPARLQGWHLLHTQMMGSPRQARQGTVVELVLASVSP